MVVFAFRTNDEICGDFKEKFPGFNFKVKNYGYFFPSPTKRIEITATRALVFDSAEDLSMFLLKYC
jgi:hypothetical protein